MGSHLGDRPRGHHPYLFAAIVIAARLPARAGAQPADGDADDPAAAAIPATSIAWELAPTRNPEERSPPVAIALSAGLTLGATITVVLGFAGEHDDVPAAGLAALLVAPSVGHWYAGQRWNDGASLRLGALLVGGAGLAVVVGCADGRDLPCDLGGDALLTGAVAYLAGTAYEIVTAPAAARARRRGRPPTTRLVVTSIHGNDRTVPGVAMVTRF